MLRCFHQNSTFGRLLAAFFYFCTLWIGALSFSANAEVLKTPEAFLSEAFADFPEPQRKSFWLKQELKDDFLDQLDYRFHQLRIRYWVSNSRTAWILDEIGKEQPITMGVVVDGNAPGKLNIVSVDILEYRESRGWEVKHDFFTRQFVGANLRTHSKKPELDRSIDGITGATLSVRAVKKVATLALLLHAQAHGIPNGETKQASTKTH